MSLQCHSVAVWKSTDKDGSPIREATMHLIISDGQAFVLKFDEKEFMAFLDTLIQARPKIFPTLR